jgi:NADH dehydrogenase FAD-containing subunit
MINKEGHCMQVKGYPHIFAIGDAIDVDDEHLAFLACQHAQLAAKNILSRLKNEQARLGAWKRNGGAHMMVLTMGKKNTVILAGTSTTITCVPPLLWIKTKGVLKCLK